MKKAVSIILSIIMVVCVMQTGSVQGLWKAATATVEASDTEDPANPVYDDETGTTKYSYVYFGSYPQSEVVGAELTDDIVNAVYEDDNAVVDGVKYHRMKKSNALYAAGTSTKATKEAFYQWSDSKSYHYFRYEPIKWRVLDNDGTSLLLMADQVLECQYYSSSDHKFTWADSPMRSWLNEYDSTYNAIRLDYKLQGGFLSAAFTDAEQEAIQKSTLATPDNKIYGTPGGVDTQDKIFLLSVEDVTNEQYGFSSDYTDADAARRIQPSEYAFTRGIWLGTYNEYYGNCWWMLRTSGSHDKAISVVYRHGAVYQEGYMVNTHYYGVTPALRVDLESDLWTIAGNVEPTESPEPSESSEPTESPEPTDEPKVIYGDLTGDGLIKLADAQFVLRMALNIVTDETEEQKIAADVDGSGSIKLSDAQLVLRMALNIISSFPIEDESVKTPSPSVPPTSAPPTSVPSETPIPTTPVPTEEPLEQVQYEASGRIWLAADSIAAKHTNGVNNLRDTIGWGVILPGYLKENADVRNTALSSRSSKSFIEEDQYQEIKDGMGEGDYLFISFGHNDEYPHLERHTDPFGDSGTEGSYKWYLKTYYIDPAIRAGTTPVLISSVVKRYFVDGDLVPQFHESYATAMKELSEEYAERGITVPYIDLHHKMGELYQELGDEATKLLHANYYYDGSNILDNVHFTYAGAQYALKFILEGLQELDLDICNFIDEDAIVGLDTIELKEGFKETDIGL